MLDRDEEYILKAFDDICKDYYTLHQLIAAYTIQQNGVAERKNRTILNMVRGMLKNKYLPKSYWAEAVTTAVYLLNKCPTKSVKSRG